MTNNNSKTLPFLNFNVFIYSFFRIKGTRFISGDGVGLVVWYFGVTFFTVGSKVLNRAIF